MNIILMIQTSLIINTFFLDKKKWHTEIFESKYNWISYFVRTKARRIQSNIIFYSVRCRYMSAWVWIFFIGRGSHNKITKPIGRQRRYEYCAVTKAILDFKAVAQSKQQQTSHWILNKLKLKNHMLQYWTGLFIVSTGS